MYFFFFLFAIVGLFSAIMVITRKNVMHAALSPPAVLRRPSRGCPCGAPLRRSPPPSCDACPAPAHSALRRAMP